jgi:hypothetical protein
MADYKSLENKIRDIVARPWTKDPKQVHHKQQQIQKKIIDEEPDMLNSKALGIPDSVIEAAKQINKGKTEVDVNPQYKPDMKDSEDESPMKGKSPGAKGIDAAKDDDDERIELLKKGKKIPSRLTGVRKEELKGKQHKIDKNKNGRIDADDFRRLRKEEVEQIDEIGDTKAGKETLKRYVKKASGRVADKSRHAGDIENRRDISPAAKEVLTKHDRKIGNSLKGISRATDKLTKEEVEHIDEAEKDKDKHFSSQPKKMQDAINMHLRKGKDYWSAVRASKVHVKEEVEQVDELDRQQGSIINRYLSKTNPDYSSPKDVKKRAPGRALALQKKWGDKNYGTSEPKVKAVTREETEQVDEVSSALLHRAFQKAKKDAGWLMPGDKGPGDKAWNRAKKFRDAGLKKQDQERKSKNVSEADGSSNPSTNSSALNRINTIATDMKKMANEPLKPPKNAGAVKKLPHVDAGAPDMFKIKEEITFSDEELAWLDAVASTFIEEGNLAAQIRDAKPSVTGHIEVNVGDKNIKIPHRKAQDFLGSYHSKRTPAEKDAHEKAFRKEIGG